MQLFIHNPDNPHKPTRIIGIGGSNPGKRHQGIVGCL